MRESEIHFSRWIFEGKEKNWLNTIIFSLIFHGILFAILYYIKPRAEIAADHSSSIHINISNLNTMKNLNIDNSNKNKIIKKQEKINHILTDTRLNSNSHFLSQKNSNSKEIEKQQEVSNNSQNKSAENNLSSFLPNSNSNYMDQLRAQNEIQNNNIVADDGDMPIEGSSLAPTNEPRIVQRYAEKDMSLFQFTQEFRERFGAIWNAEERNVPPSSPLRPGDIVYYKIYIKSNGNMQKFENLSQATHPKKDYSAVDKLFDEVISHVFPMSVPPKFANKNMILTEILAIQVVDRGMPVRYSF